MSVLKKCVIAMYLLLLPLPSLQDIATKYASLLFGITNACSSVSGTVAVYATGEVLEATKSWNAVWQVVATIYVVGNVVYLGFAKAEKKLFP